MNKVTLGLHKLFCFTMFIPATFLDQQCSRTLFSSESSLFIRYKKIHISLFVLNLINTVNIQIPSLNFFYKSTVSP